MQTFHHIATLRQHLAPLREQGLRIALVPTMGNLHNAHIALIRQAQQNADVVVASIFVNQLQFGLNEDWDRYPRTLEADSAKLKEVGCDLLFCPADTEMYPNGLDQQTRVIQPAMADILCGASRPGHFDGVTTVVTKLFNIVQPDCAVFGLKDFQQLAIIRRMVQDLCMPIEVLSGELVREADGLAMSSRNTFISRTERPLVTVLHQSLQDIVAAIADQKRDYAQLEEQAKAQIRQAGFKPDYVKIVERNTLADAAADDSKLCVLGAMYTQKARLIDNVRCEQSPIL